MKRHGLKTYGNIAYVNITQTDIGSLVYHALTGFCKQNGQVFKTVLIRTGVVYAGGIDTYSFFEFIVWIAFAAAAVKRIF